MSKTDLQRMPKRLQLWKICFLTVGSLLLALLIAIPSASAQASEKDPLKQLKLQARHAEDSSELDKAEALYLEALRLAEQQKSDSDTVEILSRVVRVKIDNHKMNQTDSLVRDAVRIVGGLNGKPGYDAEMSVWMDDMADAFYEIGEHTVKTQIKEYCLKRFVEIKLAAADHYDPKLASKCALLTTYLYHQGRYSEAIPIMEKLVQYQQRTNGGAKDVVAFNYQVLADAYLGIQDPVRAEAACNEAIRLQPNDPNHKALMERKIAQAKADQKKFDEAIAICTHALQSHNAHITGPNIQSGWDAFVLGDIQQNAGNIATASQSYRTSLDYFDKCALVKSNELSSNLIQSGQVVAAEALSRIAAKNGDSALSLSLHKRADQIRAHHPEWASIQRLTIYTRFQTSYVDCSCP